MKLPLALLALTCVALGREIIAFLIVAVPLVAPILTPVAAPPILRPVALVLKRFTVPVEVVAKFRR